MINVELGKADDDKKCFEVEIAEILSSTAGEAEDSMVTELQVFQTMESFTLIHWKYLSKE